MSLLLIGSALTEVQAAQPAATSKELSFSRFDRRARSGEKLNVVFFGGSLTWGANASDPQLTSYRALIGQRLAALYPRSRFTFWDAAIGGTGSQLGAFRLQRDVLRRDPDLVFLDFTVNDDPYEIKPDALSSYESIIRRLLTASTPVLSIRLPTWGDFQIDGDPRILDPEHQRIAEYYDVPVADVVSAMHAQARLNRALPDRWWPSPNDKTHPYDEGYAAYANAVWASYLQAVKQKAQPSVPGKTLHPATYNNASRVRLSSLKNLPKGWKLSQPNRTSAWFDALMSRWLVDEVVASAGAESWKMRFRGQTVLFFGEATTQSGKYQVLIDGKPVPKSDQPDGIFNASAGGANGNTHHTRIIATDLDVSFEHTLEIIPLLEAGQELRLESVCIASEKQPFIANQ